jgi:hypothetical protein
MSESSTSVNMDNTPGTAFIEFDKIDVMVLACCEKHAKPSKSVVKSYGLPCVADVMQQCVNALDNYRTTIFHGEDPSTKETKLLMKNGWLVEAEPPIFVQFYRSGELRHTEILDKAQVPDGAGPRYLVFVDYEGGDVTEYDRFTRSVGDACWIDSSSSWTVMEGDEVGEFQNSNSKLFPFPCYSYGRRGSGGLVTRVERSDY